MKTSNKLYNIYLLYLYFSHCTNEKHKTGLKHSYDQKTRILWNMMKSWTNGKNASPRPRVPTPHFPNSPSPHVPCPCISVPLFDTASPIGIQMQPPNQRFIPQMEGLVLKGHSLPFGVISSAIFMPISWPRKWRRRHLYFSSKSPNISHDSVTIYR